MNKKFLKDQSNNSVDFFNVNGTFEDIFKLKKDFELVGTEIKSNNTTYFIWGELTIECLIENNPTEPKGIFSKFHYLVQFRFQGNEDDALSFVKYELQKNEFPFCRIGADYFKIVERETRYGGKEILLNKWKKEEIKEDHKSQFFLLKKYDGFTIVPDNINHRQTINGWYNLYAKFPHEPVSFEVTEEHIPTSIEFMKHIFGDQYDIGLKYMQILYQFPKQMLPILCLVSTERNTGKTTFLNWTEMIFGENSVLIAPEDLTRNFNSAYIDKNIIAIDETTIDKQHTVEKLKSLATAKRATYSMKNVAEHSIPIFCKIVICTNKETEFMRIDSEEIRFWVRKINKIEVLNTFIEKALFDEIPSFLKFLSQQSEIDFSKSRMVFTKDEIQTEAGDIVKKESRSSLYKELEELFADFFDDSNLNEVMANPTDIKNKWFANNSQIPVNYIRKVLKDEMKLLTISHTSYNPFNKGEWKTGTPFIFKRNVPIEEVEIPF
jgi:hypothetical protein